MWSKVKKAKFLSRIKNNLRRWLTFRLEKERIIDWKCIIQICLHQLGQSVYKIGSKKFENFLSYFNAYKN